MEQKATISMIKSIEGRLVTGIASVFGNIDSYSDIVHRGAFKKTIKEQSGRHRHLWQHDMWSPPTAVIRSLKEIGRDDLPKELLKHEEVTGGLEVAREYLRSDRADEVFEAVSSGAVNEMSFAYEPKKWDYEEIEIDDGTNSRSIMVRNLREVRLYETSDVLWGANSLTVGSKTAIKYMDTGIDLTEDWEEPELSDFTRLSWDELSLGQKERIAAHFAWRGAEDSFDSLKLCHHLPSQIGIGASCLGGVRHCLSKLKEIPSADRRAVFDHIKSHAYSMEEPISNFAWYNFEISIEEVMTINGLTEQEKSFLTDMKRKFSGVIAEPDTAPLTISKVNFELLTRQIAIRALECDEL